MVLQGLISSQKKKELGQILLLAIYNYQTQSIEKKVWCQKNAFLTAILGLGPEVSSQHVSESRGGSLSDTEEKTNTQDNLVSNIG